MIFKGGRPRLDSQEGFTGDLCKGQNEVVEPDRAANELRMSERSLNVYVTTSVCPTQHSDE